MSKKKGSNQRRAHRPITTAKVQLDDGRTVGIVGDAPGGNYTEKMLQLGAQHPGAEVKVAHDDDCAIWRAMPCNCDPDVFIDEE